MSVRVKIHESYIKKVKKGQKARITVDAFPDKVLTGEVTKVGVLPDSQNRWMNPDMKVYLTTITIDGTNDWLKPGMSAKVEILVNRWPTWSTCRCRRCRRSRASRFATSPTAASPSAATVEVGEFNDEFIEIKKGLKEGERVLLRPPDSAGSRATTEEPSRSKRRADKPRRRSRPRRPPPPAPPPKA